MAKYTPNPQPQLNPGHRNGEILVIKDAPNPQPQLNPRHRNGEILVIKNAETGSDDHDESGPPDGKGANAAHEDGAENRRHRQNHRSQLSHALRNGVATRRVRAGGGGGGGGGRGG